MHLHTYMHAMKCLCASTHIYIYLFIERVVVVLSFACRDDGVGRDVEVCW